MRKRGDLDQKLFEIQISISSALEKMFELRKKLSILDDVLVGVAIELEKIKKENKNGRTNLQR